MRKAFDSVGLKMLKKALTRIKLPEGTISLIMSLFKRRKIKVITSFGLTEEFEAEDGLDQGEVISPLAWQIFYDLLLCVVKDEINLGYHMLTNWLIDLVHNKTKVFEHSQAVLAYANDTTWITRSKMELQKISNIANEFYKINDIEINSKKSELIVLNSNTKEKKAKDTLTIIVGKSYDRVTAKKNSELARYLGVWILSKKNQNDSLSIIKNEVSRMCKILK